MADLLPVALRAINALPAYTTMRTFACLLVLERRSTRIRFRDLAEALGISKPALSRMMRSLQIAGLAIKQREERDLRDCWISITEEGRAALREVRGEALAVAA